MKWELNFKTTDLSSITLLHFNFQTNTSYVKNSEQLIFNTKFYAVGSYQDPNPSTS